jgi:hypothetical protein
MGNPWVWDGTQWTSQDGYWTTADIPQGEQAQPADEAPPGPPPPPDE